MKEPEKYIYSEKPVTPKLASWLTANMMDRMDPTKSFSCQCEKGDFNYYPDKPWTRNVQTITKEWKEWNNQPKYLLLALYTEPQQYFALKYPGILQWKYVLKALRQVANDHNGSIYKALIEGQEEEWWKSTKIATRMEYNMQFFVPV